MKIRRIIGVIVRSAYGFIHSLDRMVDAFYWPLLDLFLWGLTSTYFVATTHHTGPVTQSIVTAIVLWTVVYRAQYEVSGNLLEELWSRNLVNMFVSPLKFSEWLVGFLSIGVIKACISMTFAGILAALFYNTSVLVFGWRLLAYGSILLMSGWALGLLVTGLILRFGTRIQATSWTLIWLVAPLAAIYYPAATLPGWAQAIAKFIPLTYVFEDMRGILFTGVGNNGSLLVAFAFNIVYMTLAYLFIHRSFRAVLNRGLVKVY